MLVAISGAQGSGKTTVLNKLQTLGYNVVERKTARSVLKEWNKTLDEVYRDPPTCVKFQDECLIRKIIDEQDALNSKQLWFTERSYADVFTYTLLTLGRYNEYDSWLLDYYNRCFEAQKKYIGVFHLQNRPGKTEDDGVRGINDHYVRLVDETLKSVLERMGSHDPVTLQPLPPRVDVPLYGIQDPLECRTRVVAEEATKLWLNKQLPQTV